MAPEIRDVANDVTLLQLPEEETVLWDHTAQGKPSRLHLSRHQKPKVFLRTNILQWVSSQLETQNEGKLHCNIYGSLSCADGSSSTGVSVILKQCESFRVNNEEITVPLVGVRKTLDFQWNEEEYANDLKTLKASCRSMVCLDLSDFVKLRITCAYYGIKCDVTVDMATIALSFVASPIASIPIVSNEVVRSLFKSKETSFSNGFLSMNTQKRLVFLSETAKNLENLPLVGIWVSGASTVLHPYIWAACVRYMSSSSYKYRLCMPPMPFLLVAYHPNSYEPTFYDCISNWNSSQPYFTSYETQICVDLPKVPVVDTKYISLELAQTEERGNEFEEAEKRLEKDEIDAPPLVITSNTDDLPMPAHRKPLQIDLCIDPRPLVPDLPFDNDITNAPVIQGPNVLPESQIRNPPFPQQPFQSQFGPYNAGASSMAIERFQKPIPSNTVYFSNAETRPAFNTTQWNPSTMAIINHGGQSTTNGMAHPANSNFSHYMTQVPSGGVSNLNQSVNSYSSNYSQNNTQISPFMRPPSGMIHNSSLGMSYGNGMHAHISPEHPSFPSTMPKSPFYNSPTSEHFLTSVNHASHPFIRQDQINDMHEGIGRDLPQSRPVPFQFPGMHPMPRFELQSKPPSPSHLIAFESPDNNLIPTMPKHPPTPMKSCLKKASSFQSSEEDDVVEITPKSKGTVPKKKPLVQIKNQKKPVAKQVFQTPKGRETSVPKTPSKISQIPVRTKPPSQPVADNQLVKVIEKQSNVLMALEDKLQKIMLSQDPTVKTPLPLSDNRPKATTENKRMAKAEMKTKPQQEIHKKPPEAIVTVAKNTKPEAKSSDEIPAETNDLMKAFEEQKVQLQMMKDQIKQLMAQNNNTPNKNEASCHQKKSIEMMNGNGASHIQDTTQQNLSRTYTNQSSMVNTSKIVQKGVATKVTNSIATMTSFIDNKMQDKTVQKTREQQLKNHPAEDVVSRDLCHRGAHKLLPPPGHDKRISNPKGKPKTKGHRRNLKEDTVDTHLSLSLRQNFDISRSPERPITLDSSELDEVLFEKNYESDCSEHQRCPKSKMNKAHYQRTAGYIGEVHTDETCEGHQRNHRNVQMVKSYMNYDDCEEEDYQPYMNQRRERNTERIAMPKGVPKRRIHGRNSREETVDTDLSFSLRQNFDISRSPERSIALDLSELDESIFRDRNYLSQACDESHYEQQRVPKSRIDKAHFQRAAGYIDEVRTDETFDGLQRNHRNVQMVKSYMNYDDCEEEDYRPYTNQRRERNTEHISIYKESCIITQTKNHCCCNSDEEDSCVYRYSDYEEPRPYLQPAHSRKMPASDLTYYGISSANMSCDTKDYLEHYGLVNKPHNEYNQRRHHAR